MKGLSAILNKELADHFASHRFVILFGLIAMVSVITAYMVGIKIREVEGQLKPQFIFLLLFTEPGAMFSLVQFVAFFGPLVGLILGFDAINRERNEGTLSKLLAQPIFRDVVINAKFMAGVILIGVMLLSIVLVITGLGLLLVGVVPGIEEICRIFAYLVISMIYMAFWLGVAILFSILFRSTATSALASLAVWIFFSFFVTIGVSILANALSSDAQLNPQSAARKAEWVKYVVIASPMELYSDATGTVIDPMRKSTRSTLAGGPPGGHLHVALLRASTAWPKPFSGNAPHHLAGGHHRHLLCGVLRRFHAAGNPITRASFFIAA